MTVHRDIVWLASYPRSGNTFLRTVLYHCFDLPSASVYREDLGGNKALESYVGHIEYENNRLRFPAACKVKLVKTHQPRENPGRAIYICRDPVRASLSLHDFYEGKVPLDEIISGSGRMLWGSWAHHITAWHPWDRPDTLLLKFEDVVTDLDVLLDQLSGFLDAPVLSTRLPDRNEIAARDGKWVRSASGDLKELPEQYVELFEQINGPTMKRMGYSL